jgi:hypothetical protein
VQGDGAMKEMEGESKTRMEGFGGTVLIIEVNFSRIRNREMTWRPQIRSETLRQTRRPGELTDGVKGAGRKNQLHYHELVQARAGGR